MVVTTLEAADGTLSDDAGRNFFVHLQLTVQNVCDSEERVVLGSKLVDSVVPDGTYTLAYSYFRPYRERVRVRSGMLVAA